MAPCGAGDGAGIGAGEGEGIPYDGDAAAWFLLGPIWLDRPMKPTSVVARIVQVVILQSCEFLEAAER